MSAGCFRIHPDDNVATLLEPTGAGPVRLLGSTATEPPLAATESIYLGHKIALADLPVGSPVMKFGTRIGHTTQPVRRGAWVHLHNLASDLDERSTRLDPQSGASPDNRDAYV